MARVYDNWERLVRATLNREQLRTAGLGHERIGSGIAGAVPPSLGRTSNIDAILQAADEIQDENPNVARILCEQAYSMAQNLDPNSDGRGVLQFKTGLMSIIKQKLAKRENVRIDRNQDIEQLWEFYKLYKRRHRVDDIQRQEQNLRESGTFSSELELRSLEMRKVIATLRALVEVLEALSKDADPEGVGRLIKEELRRIKKADAALSGELTPYNIVPLEAPSLTNAIGFFPEVRGAISAIRYSEQFPRLPADFEISGQRDADMFDLLEYVFGFQKDNIRNQRENIVLAIANAQARLGIPADADPKIDEKAINEVFLKVLDNYIKWCKYLRIRLAWNSFQAINRDRKLFLVSLYFLIWGEAANVRFLPECICYIFHHMAKDLDAILDHGEANPAPNCITEDGSVSFLDKIIRPIYETMALEAARNNNGKASHSSWRNYDDFNEYFWSPACFELKWPMREESPFLFKPKKRKRTGKSTFVEHRTFLHLYRSFHRLWIFLFVMFQALTILAFRKEKINLKTFKTILSIGPTFAIMNFIESCLDVLLMFGAYSTARGMAISRLVIRFFWCGLASVFVTYVYIKVLEEQNQQNSNSKYFRIYILTLGIYAAVRVVFALLLKCKACHTLSEMSDQSFFQFFKWIYQERYYVGRGLFERFSDYCRYVLFWLVILICKFTFAYFVQIKPLVEPTKVIIDLPSLQYSWHDLVSKNNKNALTIVSLWAPVVAIYLMDLHIWYTLLSAIIGGVMGARARLGEIRTIEMVHKRFESFPEVFVKNLVSLQAKRLLLDRQASQVSQELNKEYASIFSPFWNEIIKSLREEDFISNREMDLLSIPSNTGSLRLVQWPLFLLSSKIFLAIDLALDCKDTQADLWNRICRDEYMAYAVQECYYSIEKILHSLVDGEGRLWVERIFREINNSILENSLVITLSLKKLPLVLSRFTALTGLLIRNETPDLAKGAAKALFQLYEVVTHDLLSSDLREQLDTWNILARARNEGRLFSRLEWPKDPEIKEQVKRLHLLLTVKDSAANIPKNLEARRRLEFFSNSLFMDMPPAKPVCEMIPFSVFTPYYSETVLYSTSELQKENEDGISILFYLQKIFPDEWENFLERIGRGESAGGVDLQENSTDSLELRFWASYRGQTLARTVRGMMYYRRALMLQSYLERRPVGVTDYSRSGLLPTQGFALSHEARAQSDLKFTYVVSCQIYGQQKQRKAPEAADIALLLQRNEALRVAFIHVEDSSAADGKVSKEFFSKLVKADIHGKDQEIYSIRLPGDPKLGEGKPENQNHAIIFTRGEAIQTIDMNQDNYLEEAMKMRNLLEEFRTDHGIRPPSILGVREHVFTGRNELCDIGPTRVGKSFEEKEKQVQRIRSIFHRQLSVPLANSSATLLAYKSWEVEQGAVLDVESSNLDGISSNVALAYQKALEMCNARAHLEEQISRQELSDSEKFQQYMIYLKYEQSSGDPGRVQLLYERAITDFPVSSDLWLDYTQYLDKTLKVGNVVRDVYSRATKNCPWVGELWVRSLLSLERSRASEEEISTVFEKSLLCAFSTFEEYLDLFLTRIDGLRRRILFSGEVEGVLDYSLIRETFQRASDYLSEQMKNTDGLLRLYAYWAHLEQSMGKDMVSARGVWERLLKISGAMLEAWQSYISMEIELGHINEARSIYKRCYSKRFTGTGSEDICHAWLRFEREYGTLEDFDHSVQKVTPRLEELQLFRSQQESKSLPESADQKEHSVKKTGREKRKSDSNISYEQSPAKRQKNVPQKPKKVHDKEKRQVQNLAEENEGRETKQTVEEQPKEQPIKDAVPGRTKGFTDECTAFLSNINLKATYEDLRRFFSDVGGVSSIRILHDKFTGKSRGLAYVDFIDDEHLAAAVAKNKQMFFGKKLSIARSNPKQRKDSSGERAPTEQAQSHQQTGNAGTSASKESSIETSKQSRGRGDSVQLKGKNTFAVPRNVRPLGFPAIKPKTEEGEDLKPKSNDEFRKMFIKKD